MTAGSSAVVPRRACCIDGFACSAQVDGDNPRSSGSCRPHGKVGASYVSHTALPEVLQARTGAKKS